MVENKEWMLLNMSIQQLYRALYFIELLGYSHI